MILHINNSEYDYHTLVKVAEMAGLAGLVFRGVLKRV